MRGIKGRMDIQTCVPGVLNLAVLGGAPKEVEQEPRQQLQHAHLYVCVYVGKVGVDPMCARVNVYLLTDLVKSQPGLLGLLAGRCVD